MKKLFWLLVAANVIFFAVMKSGVLGNGENAQAPLPLHPEKIALLTDAQSIPAASQPVAVAPLPASSPAAVSAPLAAKTANVTCVEWGDFTGADLEQAANALKKLQLGDKLSQREVDRPIGFWVYIPPLKDKASVNQKLLQLKERGVTDYFVVPDAGEWLNAISLGVFKTSEAAQNFMAELRTKGVNTAKMGERSSKLKAKLFVINNLNDEMVARLSAVQKNFPVSELKHVSCH